MMCSRARGGLQGLDVVGSRDALEVRFESYSGWHLLTSPLVIVRQ
jgi:hypothetical protein